MMKKLSLWVAAMYFCVGNGNVFGQGNFVHPGLLHSEQDIEEIKQRLANNDAQTVAAFNVLKNSWVAAKPETDIWGVTEYIKRGIAGDENYMNAYRNAAKAYQCALLWKLTDDRQWANRAIYVLNQYSLITKGIGGNTNQSLVPGFIGYQFLNAAELMRDYDGWAKEDFERFKQWMIDVWFTTAQDFLERRHDTVTREGNWYHYHSNWGLGNAVFCVSLGVFADLPDIYNYGMWWIKEGPGNESLYVGDSHPWKTDQGMCGYGWGLIPWFHEDERGPLGYLNQMQESGRDQGHAMAALGLLSYALQTAYNQGDNAFCNLYNPLIPGMAGRTMVAGAAEYVAMYNCNQVDPEDIPYTPNWWMGALNATGRGQHRPIWQLFVNHFENRMGIPMKYCKRMTTIVGIEHGGDNTYGVNSGGYDHTGYGTLMHNDKPVTEENKPTILLPEVVCEGEVRPYAEMKNVAKGTTMTLRAALPEGETDTGNWEWEDGVKGNSRDITANTSGLYRLHYTNAHGVRSTQMFCISVSGEGIRATLTPWVEYEGVRMTNTTEFSAVAGREVTLGADYANWNYVSNTRWYDEDGSLLAAAGSYTFTQEAKDRVIRMLLTNESGVQIEQVFTIRNSAVIPTLEVDGVAQEGLSAMIPVGRTVTMMGQTTSIRYRNGVYTWSSGEHTNSIHFDNLQTSLERHLDWVDSSSTSRTYEASFDFVVNVYQEGQHLEDGYYRIKERETDKYLNSNDMIFDAMDSETDSAAYVWHITWDDKTMRYKIYTHNDSAYVNYTGKLTARSYNRERGSFFFYRKAGGDEIACNFQISEDYGHTFWGIDEGTLTCDQITEMPSDFTFVLEPVQSGEEGGETAIAEVEERDAALSVKACGTAILVHSSREVQVMVYSLSGLAVEQCRLGRGSHVVDVSSLPAGVYMVYATDGASRKTVKFIKKRA